MHACDPDFSLDDTSPHAREQLIALYRAMTRRQRLEQMCDMSRTARALIEHDLRRRYPDSDDRELRLRLFARWLDAPTMRRYYGWDPDREGL